MTPQEIENLKNIPDPDPEDFKDFTYMQLTKIAIGLVIGFLVIFLLYKIDKNQVTQIDQWQILINSLPK